MTKSNLHVPNVVTDGGPWAQHDQACAVCSKNHAVLDVDTGHFEPCWECQREGWKLAQRRKWWRCGGVAEKMRRSRQKGPHDA